MDPLEPAEVFADALALPPEDRSAFLERVCLRNEALRSEVESLLQVFQRFPPPPESADTGSLQPQGARVPPEPSLSNGSVLSGRYRIDAYLAAGGMGQVYRGHDLELDVPLALKTIHPRIASDPAALRRFKREVLLARSVTHTSVCRIFDIGRDEESGVSFLTMELLGGETLSRRLATKGRFTPSEALPLIRQMADALDSAHRAGVVHRDFKSPNIMLVPTDDVDRLVITDFGLASTATDGGVDGADSSEASRLLRFMGTPAYVSPEQVAGGFVGPRSDLYSLGVVVFEMITGRLPFRGVTAFETARAHLEVPPPRPSSLVDVEDTWEEAMLRLLAKESADRFPTAYDLVLALEGRGGCAAVRHSLPAEHDTFVGRQADLEALAAHLETSGSDTGARLLTLRGPGGTGKTRLAVRYGWDSLSRWPGGVWFCDLTEARGLTGIVHALASALDVSLSKDDPVVELGHAIAGRGRSLLILDNFEQLVESAEATVSRWLARATETSFLVTSRVGLNLVEERTHELGSLDQETEGVDLFEARAQLHRPGFVVDESNRKQVIEVVQRLDGLPLAIELAASRLRMLRLEQLRDRLTDRLGILTGGRRGRHANLRATMDWSWELLHPWEQSAAEQLSIFEAGFTLEAAEAVVDLPTDDETPIVLDVVQALVDKSWIHTRVVLGGPRFEMYSTLHEYAAEKFELRCSAAHTDTRRFLERTALRDAVEIRHGDFFAEMGSVEAMERLSLHGGVARRVALHVELDNLIAATRRAIQRRDGATATQTYAAAHSVLSLRGSRELAIELGRAALDAADAPGQQARILQLLAIARRASGKIAAARDDNQRSLQLYRELGDRTSEGTVLLSLSILHSSLGESAAARESVEAALTLFRALGSRRLEGVALGCLGTLLGEHGRIDEARALYEEALSIHREVGDRVFEGVTLGNIGNVHQKQSRSEEAFAHYAAALTIHREVGNRRLEGIILGNLGTLLSEEQDNEAAQAQYEAALAIHRELGNRPYEGVALGNLAALDLEGGRLEAALLRFENALAIHREVGNRRKEALALGRIALIHGSQGRVEEASRVFAESMEILRSSSWRVELGSVLCMRGEVAFTQGRLADASADLVEAESIATELAAVGDADLMSTIDGLRSRLSGQVQ